MNFRFFFLSVFLFFGSILYAQSNFVIVERKDVKEYDEFPVYNPDVRVSGYLKYRINYPRGSLLTEPEDDVIPQRYTLDYEIHFHSEVSQKVSLNFSLTNLPDNLHKDGLGPFYPIGQEEREDFPEENLDAFNQVYLGDAYIDYQYTPEFHIRAGIQKLNLGDETGLVFQGRINALSLDCGLGTWCFSGGTGKISPDDSSSVSWLKIDYPIYDSGEEIEDLWNPGKKIKQDYMQFDFYGLIHNDKKLALAKYGGYTWDQSSDSSYPLNPDQVLENGLPVFYDTSGQYAGINFYVQYFGTAFRLNFVSLDSSRNYYNQITDQSEDSLGKRDVSGTAFYANFEQVILEKNKIGLRYFTASGAKTPDTTADISRRWKRNEEGFYSIRKGAYGHARTYFGGLEGTGSAHSVSNVTFASAYYSFRSAGGIFGFDLEVFDFNRTQPVLNTAGEKVTHLGSEVDIGFLYYPEKDLQFQAGIDLFFPGDAYVSNDNTTPPEEKADDFSNFRLSFQYNFR